MQQRYLWPTKVSLLPTTPCGSDRQCVHIYTYAGGTYHVWGGKEQHMMNSCGRKLRMGNGKMKSRFQGSSRFNLYALHCLSGGKKNHGTWGYRSAVRPSLDANDDNSLFVCMEGRQLSCTSRTGSWVLSASLQGGFVYINQKAVFFLSWMLRLRGLFWGLCIMSGVAPGSLFEIQRSDIHIKHTYIGYSHIHYSHTHEWSS